MMPRLGAVCFLTIISTLFILSTAFSQRSPNMFQVINLPRKTGYNKDVLNAEMASLADKRAVLRLLRAKKFPPETVLLIQILRKGGITTWWTINTSNPNEEEDGNIILQSKDNVAYKFYKLSDFKTHFKDTIAVIDTLSIESYIKDYDYPNDQYIVSSICLHEKHKATVPFKDNTLIFAKELICELTGIPLSVDITNTFHPEKVMAKCKLLFLSEEQKETLKELAEFIFRQDPQMDIKEVVTNVSQYAVRHYGKLGYSDLFNWVQKQLREKKEQK